MAYSDKTKNILCIAAVVVVLVVGSLAVGFTSVDTKAQPVKEENVHDKTQQKLDKIINKLDEVHDKIQEYHGK